MHMDPSHRPWVANNGNKCWNVIISATKFDWTIRQPTVFYFVQFQGYPGPPGGPGPIGPPGLPVSRVAMPSKWWKCLASDGNVGMGTWEVCHLLSLHYFQ